MALIVWVKRALCGGQTVPRGYIDVYKHWADSVSDGAQMVSWGPIHTNLLKQPHKGPKQILQPKG